MAAGFAQTLLTWTGRLRFYDVGVVFVGQVSPVSGDSAISIMRRAATLGAALFGGTWEVYPLTNGTVRIASTGAATWSLDSTGDVTTRLKLPASTTIGPTIDGSGPHDDGFYISLGLRVGGVEVRTSSSPSAASSAGMGGAPVRTPTRHAVSAHGTITELYALEETVFGRWDIWTDDPVSLPRLWFTEWERGPVVGNRDPSFMVSRTNAMGVA